jgi:DNA polymerase-3 subunit gamma/tau
MDFAAKYRPTSFSQVIGQDTTTTILRGMLRKNTIPPLLLLCGPRSAGKTTLARLLGLYANCVQLTAEDEPCGTCTSCKMMLKAIRGEGEHPDFMEKNAASDRGIDMIRALETVAHYAPRYKHRFILLDEVHALTAQAFQAGLKLFEEPPGRTRFIFCTTEPEQLPQTIASRCTVFPLDAIPPITVAKLLHRVAKQENQTVPKEALIQIAEATHGHPREALKVLQQAIDAGDGTFDLAKLPQILAQSDAVAPYIAVQKWMRAVLEGRYGNAMLALRKAPSMEYFAGAAIDTLRQMVHLWISRRS